MSLTKTDNKLEFLTYGRIWKIMEYKSYTCEAIIDMRIVYERFGFSSKPKIAIFMKRIYIPDTELNPSDKNYKTQCHEVYKKKYPEEQTCYLTNMYKKEINIIINSYPEDHFIRNWSMCFE